MLQRRGRALRLERGAGLRASSPSSYRGEGEHCDWRGVRVCAPRPRRARTGSRRRRARARGSPLGRRAIGWCAAPRGRGSSPQTQRWRAARRRAERRRAARFVATLRRVAGPGTARLAGRPRRSPSQPAEGWSPPSQRPTGALGPGRRLAAAAASAASASMPASQSPSQRAEGWRRASPPQSCRREPPARAFAARCRRRASR